MARLFNVEVFNQIIGQGQPYYTGQEFYDLLGSADDLFAQILVDSVQAASTDVDVTFQTTNVLQEWTWKSSADKSTISVTTLDDAPAQGGAAIPPGEEVIAAYGRFKVTTTKTGAAVRIVVCGRSH